VREAEQRAAEFLTQHRRGDWGNIIRLP
jgi:hypothetical protein